MTVADLSTSMDRRERVRRARLGGWGTLEERDAAFRDYRARTLSPNPRRAPSPEIPEFLEALAHKSLAERDWAGYLGLFSQHESLRPFFTIEAALSDAEYWPLLAEIWVGTNAGYATSALEIWRWLFRHPHRYRDGMDLTRLMAPDTDSARGALNRWDFLPSTVQIFRGQSGASKDLAGFSWTLSRETALRFAQHAPGGRLLSATLPKAAAVAFLPWRQEEEVLVFPESVQCVRSESVPRIRRNLG